MSRTVEVASVLGGVALAGVGLVPFLGRDPGPDAWFGVRWPRELPEDAVVAFLRHLSASRRPFVVAFEVHASAGRIEYRIGVARHDVGRLGHMLAGFIADALLTEIDPSKEPSGPLRHGLTVSIGTRQRALRMDAAEEVSRSVVAALAQPHGGRVILRCLVGPRLQPHHVPNDSPGLPSTGRWLRDALVGNDASMDARTLAELRHKVGDHGFRAQLTVATSVADPTIARALLGRVVGALRVAEAPGAHLRVRPIAPGRIAAGLPRRWAMTLNVSELVGLLGWPLGDGDYRGVRRIASRRLPVPAGVPLSGRILGDGNHPSTLRPIALGARDALMHTHVLGPTGVGKSTLLAALAIQDIAAGRGVVVIEPKGDLIADILGRIPKHRQADVVLLDPSEETTTVGLNPLAGGAAELVSDGVMAVFRGLYRDYLGPRTTDVLHAALLTLAKSDHSTLVALPLLLSDARLRQELTAPVRADLALGPFWAWYEALSDPERSQVIGPVMNKVRPFLLRERVRHVLGQARPRFDIAEVFTKNKILLVPLDRGTLGSETAALLGSLVVAGLWQAAQARSSVVPAGRHPVSLIIDEFQDFLHLPTDLADVLAQARGLGLGLTLAHQHLAQLGPAVRAAVLANARSRICFRLSADDAAIIAKTSDLLDARDLQSLGRWEVYASLISDGESRRFCSATSRRLPAPCSDHLGIRALSRAQYARPRSEIEAELRALIEPGVGDTARGVALGSRPRRRSTGAENDRGQQ